MRSAPSPRPAARACATRPATPPRRRTTLRSPSPVARPPRHRARASRCRTTPLRTWSALMRSATRASAFRAPLRCGTVAPRFDQTKPRHHHRSTTRRRSPCERRRFMYASSARSCSANSVRCGSTRRSTAISRGSAKQGRGARWDVRKEPLKESHRHASTFAVSSAAMSIVLSGEIPPELWKKVGIRLTPELRANAPPTLRIELEINSIQAANIIRETEQALADIELTGKSK